MSAPKPLLETFRATLDRRRAESALRTLTICPPTSIDFSSNDFLSLSTSSSLRSAYLQELAGQPCFTLGSGGSRLLDGNSIYAERLEKDIAAFHGAPAGLLFNSGFDANSGFFACIPQPGDVIIYDQYIHASVHEGMRLSRAGVRLSFAHNTIDHFQRLLRDQIDKDPLVRCGTRNVFVAIESVYSMDGDLAPIAEFVEWVERLLPLGNGYIIVDEAHSTGVFGARGRGIVCDLGLEDKIFARLHTFGKALSCGGAIILCSPLTKQYLVNYARPLIYTTFMSFPCLAAIRVAYTFMFQGETEPLSQQLRALIKQLYGSLGTLETKLSSWTFAEQPLQLPSELPRSPIFSVLTRNPRSLANYCQDGGFVVRAIVPPTVPLGGERVRICLHAGNTSAEVEGLVARIRDWLELQRNRETEEEPKLEFEKSRL